MNLPPALTWLQLFPRGASVACDTGPAWFGEMLRRRPASGSACAVLAAWGKSWDDLGDLAKWDGIAAINCRGVTARRLERSGFSYIRKFAVVPNLDKPRFFVSLDSARVAAASFSPYTPARASARLKKTAA